MKKLLSVIAIAAALMASGSAEASNRTAKRIGLSLGLLGDPFPTLLGYNLNFNLARGMRLVGGYGAISGTASDGSELKIATMGGGVRFFVPSWNFSPVVGASMAKVTFTGTGTLSGFDGNASHIYGTAGFDWQAGNGFNLGFGANFSGKTGVGAVPYINLGWYF
jgi:hypothetical protein